MLCIVQGKAAIAPQPGSIQRLMMGMTRYSKAHSLGYAHQHIGFYRCFDAMSAFPEVVDLILLRECKIFTNVFTKDAIYIEG